MDIAEVVKQTGIPASRLRYYEELGLITSHSRKGLRRQYAPEVLESLGFIVLAQSAGFSLADIKNLVIPATQGKQQLKRDMLANKAAEIDRQVRQLQAIAKSLRHAAACPASSHFECPSFLKLMRKTYAPKSSDYLRDRTK